MKHKELGMKKNKHQRSDRAWCNKIYKEKKNVTLVCFVGEGQYIHEGEEG